MGRSYSIKAIVARKPRLVKVTLIFCHFTLKGAVFIMSENIQLNPAGKMLIPLDKVCQDVFNPKYHDSLRGIVEDKKSKIVTKVRIEFLKGDLNPLDKLIFCAAISEQRAGNEIFTIRRLWQKIGGSHTLTAEMKEKIVESVEKLICTRVEVNMSDINAKRHYTDREEVIFKDFLLPCQSVEVRVNGKVTDGAYKFWDASPLLKVAELKKQFADRPIALLDVPKLHNSELVLKIKFYLLERITAIIGSHKKRKAHITGKKKGGGFEFKRATKLKTSILLDTLFEQCGLSDAPRWQKQDARNTITKIMNHFKAEKIVADWHFERADGQFHAVEFEPPKE